MTAVKLFKIRRGERTFRRLDEGDAISISSTIDDRIIIGFSGTFAGDVTIGGNLTVNGTSTTINSTTHDINDNVIVLNDGETGAGVVTLGTVSGFEVDRGSLDNVRWVWYEPADLFRPEFAAGAATHVGMFLDPTAGTHVGDRDYNDARYLLESNNLSDLVSDVTSRQNLGVEIGVDVAAQSHVGSGGASHADVIAAGASGFMTGADKTKLNGIETGATADQTAAEILAALITVDGTGTLLDADLLDGSHASAFATSAQGALADSALQDVVDDTTPQLGGNLDVNGNSIVSVSAGDIAITPDTTGDVILDGLKWPQADGTGGHFLKTDGAGQLSFAAAGGGGALANVVEDTTPQLGGQLDVNGNSIVSVTNGDITLAPNGSGNIVMSLGTGLLSMTSSGTKFIQLTSTDAGAGIGPDIELFRDSPSPAANDFLGSISLFGESSTSTKIRYARLRGYIVDPTNGTEDGGFEIAVRINGGTASRFNVENGVTVGPDSTTMQGDGTLNASSDLYINNVSVTTSLAGKLALAGGQMTGNITMAAAETVDGRDLSVDGSKLDGIAASATANPNALDNIVEDLSPQLGGNLDVQANSITTSTVNGNINFNMNGTGDIIITSTDSGGASGPNITLIRDSASPLANDKLGAFEFFGEDSASASVKYARIRSFILDPTVNVEAGSLDFSTPVAGTFGVRVTIDAGLRVGSPTGGDKGVGTINATAVYDDNVLLTANPNALDNIIEDTTPQLGGQLDVNGNALGDGTNPLLGFVEDASSVNWLVIENEATGSGPILRSVGADTNVDLNFESKGTGEIIVNNPVVLRTYTVATAPTATAGAIAFFSDGATGSPVLAYGDGANWLRCDTRATIASS